MQTINLTLTAQQMNTIMASLGKMPFEAVFELIGELQKQVQPQVQSQSDKVEK